MLTGVLGALKRKREETGDEGAFLTLEELQQANTITLGGWFVIDKANSGQRSRKPIKERHDRMADEWAASHGSDGGTRY